MPSESDPAPGNSEHSDAISEVNFEGILAAAEAVAAHLPPTPAWSYPLLNRRTGVEILVKHENTQPTGAFKVRGGLSLAAEMAAAGDRRGLVAASTGNHAQSVAYAARLAGVRAVVVMPQSAPLVKQEAVRAMGAELVIHGAGMDEALARAAAIAAEDGLRYVDPGNEPAIVHGHGTVYLELFRQYPDLEAVYVPIGSGSGAAGACLVRDEIGRGRRVIGVQSAQAPAAYRSWTSRQITSAPNETRVSGLATGRGFELPQRILRDRLDAFLLVEDDEIDEAMRILARDAHTLVETAGAAALAGLMADPDRPAHCAIVCTGGNAGASELEALAVAPRQP